MSTLHQCLETPRGDDRDQRESGISCLRRLLPERGCPVCHLAALEQERNIPHQPLQSFLARYRFNAPDQKADGLTPLMMACIEGCIPLVKELLSSKAEVNEKVEVSIRDIQLGGRQTALTVAAALSSSKASPQHRTHTHSCAWIVLG